MIILLRELGCVPVLRTGVGANNVNGENFYSMRIKEEKRKGIVNIHILLFIFSCQIEYFYKNTSRYTIFVSLPS